jgi:hypothetical protein
MFSALVDVFFVPMLEVEYRVVSDFLDEGVLVDSPLAEKYHLHFIDVQRLDMFRPLLAHPQEELHGSRVGDCCVLL